jgi:N-methylhydantoinase A
VHTRKKADETFRVGTDIGGTFTDIVFSGSKGTVLTKKTLSTPDDYSRAIAQGINEVLTREGILPSCVKEVVHGTTIVTNTCIELTGAKVGLITTEGFRDILEIARGRMPELYNLAWNKPVPLVPRYLRFEVEERTGKHGEIIRDLNTKQVHDAVTKLIAGSVEAVAICLFNSPLNPKHEEMVEAIVRKKAPQLYVCRSTKIRPMLKEYERTSETVVNAYVMPVVTTYLRLLRSSLASIGVNAPLYVMQSSGGMISAEEASEVPVEIVECGPAAGVVGAAHMSRQQNIKDIITLDLGGTTTKASVVESGRYTRSAEYEVGAGIHRASRLHKGKGYVLRIPSIDIAEIGAGGGSIVWMDKGGLMNVGPKSAGASPGPVCYNKGGEDPTLTDSYVMLGYMNPNYLLGGDFALNAEKARKIYKEKVASALNGDLLDAAYGVYEIANSNIRRAITSVSSERGRDPRKFSLFVFGGAGALHGAAVARSIGMKEVIIAPLAGIFSAYGLLCADIQRNYVKAYDTPLDAGALAGVNSVLEEMTRAALKIALQFGHSESAVKVERYADLRYRRQQSELTMMLPEHELHERNLKSLYEHFHKEYEATFGFRLTSSAIEIVNLRVSSTIAISKPATDGLSKNGTRIPKNTAVVIREAYFGPLYGTMQVPVASLDDISASSQKGPIFIDTYDSTIIVPPQSHIKRSENGNLTITLL